MSKIVCTSLYADPFHAGHLECLEMAKALGDQLYVIVNTDKQAVLKKGKSFMPEDGRLAIIRALKCVDAAFLASDEDGSVCQTLRQIRPHIFAKGGDRFAGNIPEKAVCDELGIQIVDGLGEKIESSSRLTGIVAFKDR